MSVCEVPEWIKELTPRPSRPEAMEAKKQDASSAVTASSTSSTLPGASAIDLEELILGGGRGGGNDLCHILRTTFWLRSCIGHSYRCPVCGDRYCTDYHAKRYICNLSRTRSGLERRGARRLGGLVDVAFGKCVRVDGRECTDMPVTCDAHS